ncbi:MAG TPA: ATP-binding cassette domain-containing protein [Mycobacteriales bacterium]|jgi:osmoprotectant transport system ATP-binding protein|nr:ATP-binding cassette domain-containing protein [Mycobacteriales bacterium]
MIRLDRVAKRYPDGTVAVEELSLDVPPGAIAVLVGPSGCGKTTTMRMVNRLVEPTSGRIFVGGDDVTAADPVKLRRNIGYVIQQVGLFPHQTVAANVATVPRLLRWERRRTRDRVDELLDLVGLDPAVHRDRYPHQLSGGQRQRVGVARALAADPPVLLMDEPFGAVDPVARDRLQAEFLRLQEQVRKTVLFVTHDIDEAIRLGDRIAVMREGGRLEQYAAPATLLSAPATEFVADFVGADRTLRRLSVLDVDVTRATDWPTVEPDRTAAEAMTAMDAAEADWAVVLGTHDAPPKWLSRAAASGQSATGLRAGDLAVPSAVTHRGETVERALAALLAREGPGAILVDGEGAVVGVLTPGALLSGARRVPPAS